MRMKFISVADIIDRGGLCLGLTRSERNFTD